MSDDDKRNPNNPDNPGDENDAFWAFESDPDLAREMESLNQELANLEQNASTDDAGESATGESEDGNAPEDVSDEFSQIMNANAEIGFDDELEGILGNKAKRAILVTRLTSADLLAAFCSLADITENVGQTVRARVEARKTIKSKTSLNRIESQIMVGLPVFMMAALLAISPSHREFYSQPSGWALIALAVVLDALAYLMMRKMGDVKLD